MAEAEATWVCPKCGAKNDPDFTRCRLCAAENPAPPAPRRTCAACGHEHADTCCPLCGSDAFLQL